jgi:arsenate reductase (thioredoxin)
VTTQAPAIVTDHVRDGAIRVLFVCVGNSARSILAEAILRQVGGDRFEAHSAGSAPRGVNPLALRTLAEAGLPTDGYASTKIDAYLGQRFDYVITLCDEAREACPVFPGVQDALHWSYDDPAAVEGSDERRLSAFRQVYRQLSERIRTFVMLAERQRRESTPGELDTTPEEATRIGILRQVPLFQGLTDRAIAAVARVANEVRFEAGEALVREGEPGRSFLIVETGEADVTRDGETIRTLRRGDFLGEIALLDGGTRTATVTSASPVSALCIEREAFLRLMDESSAVRFGIIEALSSRLRHDADRQPGSTA